MSLFFYYYYSIIAFFTNLILSFPLSVFVLYVLHVPLLVSISKVCSPLSG